MRLFQAALEIFHISVGITIALRLAETDAVDDGCVVEGVGYDGIIFRQKRFKHAAVRIEASCVEDGVVRLEVVGNSVFERLVSIHRAADEAHGRHTIAALVHHVLGSLNKSRMVGESEVVVGAEVDHLFAGYVDRRCLRAFDDTFTLVETCIFDLLQLSLQVLLKFSVHLCIVLNEYSHDNRFQSTQSYTAEPSISLKRGETATISAENRANHSTK